MMPQRHHKLFLVRNTCSPMWLIARQGASRAMRAKESAGVSKLSAGTRVAEHAAPIEQDELQKVWQRRPVHS